MTPDSDTYGHILVNAALWYTVLLGPPVVFWTCRRVLNRLEGRLDQTINLHVHRALYPNVRIFTPRELPAQRKAHR